jgi:two-component system, NtrC family, sensor histidine kinase AtoS
MTTAFSPRSNSGSTRRGKAPGEAELLALFHFLPYPALLVDNLKDQIIQANTPFLQLTAFASIEVNGRNLRDLVAGLPAHPLVADDGVKISLERRNRTVLPAVAQIRMLDTAGQWLVLVFEPQEERQKSLVAHFEQVVQALSTLNQAQGDDLPRHRLERGLDIIRELLDASAVAIYQVEEKEPTIWRAVVSGDEVMLPESIPSGDLLRLSHTFIWRPGRRVQTELHRSARIQNLTYLASTLINQKGLLVVAERRQDPSDQLGVVLESFSLQLRQMMAQMTQVSDLRRLALENKRELSVWRSVGENAQEGILLLDSDLNVAEMNLAAEWMLGYADWEVKGQPVENILIGPERLMPALETAGQGIPTHNMGNVSLHRRNGQSFPAHVQIIPVHREGDTLAIVIFFTDVSEHEEIRNRTQQLEQRAVLGEVTAVFAHEVRNPINNISTGLQLLSVKLPENDPSQENISRLLNDCNRLNHLMESVLNFSRHVEHKFESVNIEMLLRRLLDRWYPRMAKVNVAPYFQIEENTPPVMADPRSLEQVFTNLVSNAVEAMSASGGTLAIRVSPFHMLHGRPQVEVTISDNGPGIPDEIRDRIFEPFITTKAQGTGLGLAITKRIVTAHRGSISVNTFPGGTVFHVLLSAYQGESE